MLESLIGNNFEYQKLSQEEQQKRGILGRLKGVIADFKNPTRNGRLYSEKLWDKVFNDNITQEKIKNRCMFGELSHPLDDREELDPEKICICLAEQPKKDNKGHLVGIFDILNTPCGNILKTLLDYGTTVGISSRGSGDTFINSNQQEEVDADSYDCTGWDVVFVPAVEAARLQVVTESYHGRKSLSESLFDLLDKADEKDKPVMKSVIDDYMQFNTMSNEESTLSSDDVDINDAICNNEEVDDDQADLVQELQRVLMQKKKLADMVSELQQHISVCNAKVQKQEEIVSKQKQTIQQLSDSVKLLQPLKDNVQDLSKQLSMSDNELQKQESLISNLRNKIKRQNDTIQTLKEDVNKQKNISKELEKYSETQQNAYSKEFDVLNEQYQIIKKDLLLKETEFASKLEENDKLVEHYKKIANHAVNKYIASQAVKIGVDEEQIKSRLTENYSFRDIDTICENLSAYRVNMNSLPFNTSNNQVKARVRGNSSSPIKMRNQLEDEVDGQLLRMSGLK